MAAIGGAAAASSGADGATARRRVGIVGGGAAGVCLAWLLDGDRDVVLLEARPNVGGNVVSADVTLDGSTFRVDLGAQYFHPGPYPIYVKLLTALGLYPPSTTGQSHSFPATITIFSPGEATPRFVSPSVPWRLWPLLAPWNSAGVTGFATAFSAAKAREQDRGSWSLTMGDWLDSLNLPSAQTDGMILPWAASLFSGNIEQARTLSARATMIFAAKALPDIPTDPIVYYVLNKGLIEALRRMLLQTSTVQVLTRAVVSGVEKLLPAGGAGWAIHCADGRRVDVDDVVFASSGPSTSALLSGIPGAGAMQAAVAGIQFFDAQLALHTDPVYAPGISGYRSFLNCRVQRQGGFCEASMWMAEVLDSTAPATAAKLWKSWITHRSQPPAQILQQIGFKHMLPSVDTLNAQVALAGLQGQGGLWVAGGYTLPYDSQETAILSAARVASGLLGAANSRTQALVAEAAAAG